MTEVKTQMVNGVGYLMPPESSIADRRSFKRQFPQKSSYGEGEEIIIDFNSGAEFLNAHRSWLKFTVAVAGAGAAAASWGLQGGAANVFDRVVVSTRSGVELSRLETANAYYAKKIRYGCSAEFVQTFGAAMGYTPIGGAAVTAIGTYCIPLAFLSPFFEGDGKSLVPPQIAAGLRISLTLAPRTTALVAAGAVQSYTLSNMSVQSNLSMLTDDWQRKLNEISASQGLAYAWCEAHTTNSVLAAAQTSVNIQVRKAAARALSAMTVSRGTATIILQTADSMASEAYNPGNQFQWRLGSMYPTMQPITNSTEAYFIAQSATDGGLVNCMNPNGVSLATFLSGQGVTSCSLERSDIALNDVLNVSGLPTNNSRALDVDIRFGTGTNRTTVLYMKHVKIARAFLENVVVSE